MVKLERVRGLVLPLDRSNVDTDAIIPKQFLKSIQRTGFGVHLFDAWRYKDTGYPSQDCSKRPLRNDFVLNFPRYQGASILLTRDNFGCGSSREHAPWALYDYGIRVIIAPSFADIFFNNCFKNGLLPIVLAHDMVNKLFSAVESEVGYTLEVDLQTQKIILPSGDSLFFEIDSFRKYLLLNGLDDIGLVLLHAERIKQFEKTRKQSFPWLFFQP